ncbi:MAG TPA: ABC transporter permease [Candidatus Caccovicinus merdipullorum]|uniref:ABC transporter permease n=1 Tax=Candidatus Caccovicinus merdipullorum TaxID=2840724 RepID=A0A9D1KGP2_9FIRM|nr:ABC transporter permease [Candidatus Caccovicinus merdipullorum]
MIKHIVKRILIAIPVLICVILVIFVMLRILPGNPAETMAGEHVSQAVIDKISREMGLDEPLYIQFFKYLANAVRGDFGTSYRLNRNVTGIILEAFPNTVKLSICAAVIAWVIGITAGLVAAINQNRILDRLFMGVSLAGVSMPVFMIALVLQYLFAFQFKIFPVSGYDSLACMVLPAISLGWNSAGSIARMTRSNLVEVMQGDYIRTARAKGLRESGVIIGHALKNAMLPVVTMMALQISSMLSGAVLTESVFGIPGIGRLAVNAIETRDMPLLQGTVIFTTILVIIGNLVADILYSVLDPRIREVA